MTDPADQAEERAGLLGQALDRLGAALERVLPEAVGRVVEDLGQSAVDEPDARERQGLQTVSAILRAEARARAQGAAKALRERADKCLEYTRHARDENQALALIEEEELQQQIFAAEVARAARHACSADYAGYTGRIRSLLPRLWESDELNPAGARTVAAAAVTAFARLGATGRAAVVLRESLARHLPAPVARVIDEVDAWLRGQGVRPRSPADVEMPAEPAAAATPATGAPDTGAPDTGASAAAPSRPLDGLPASSARPPPAASDAGIRSIDATAQTADAARKLGRSAFANDPGRAPLQVLATLQPVVEIERDAVAFAHSIDSLPYSRESRAGFFGNVRDRLRAAGVPPAQLSVIEVVAAMFDYVIDDRRLPEAAKPLIWRMQQPVVALALLDPAYLGDEPRSLRRLVENLGAIVNAYADDLTRGSELHRRLETVVRAVEIVAGALQTRSAVMARQVEQRIRARRAQRHPADRPAGQRTRITRGNPRPPQSARLSPTAEPRTRARGRPQRLVTILGERLDRHEVPESVREFVLNVWLRHLRTALLRDGEDSAEFKLSLQVVDDLLWSLDGTRERQSRRVLGAEDPAADPTAGPGPEGDRRSRRGVQAVLRRTVPDPPAQDAAPRRTRVRRDRGASSDTAPAAARAITRAARARGRAAPGCRATGASRRPRRLRRPRRPRRRPPRKRGGRRSADGDGAGVDSAGLDRSGRHAASAGCSRCCRRSTSATCRRHRTGGRNPDAGRRERCGAGDWLKIHGRDGDAGAREGGVDQCAAHGRADGAAPGSSRAVDARVSELLERLVRPGEAVR